MQVNYVRWKKWVSREKRPVGFSIWKETEEYGEEEEMEVKEDEEEEEEEEEKRQVEGRPKGDSR